MTIVKTNKQKYRWLSHRIGVSRHRRLIFITGARQTGKTTLVKAQFRELRYVNLDIVEEREALDELRTRAWGSVVGPSVLDEAQKLPSVFDKVKWAFNEGEIDFSIKPTPKRCGRLRIP